MSENLTQNLAAVKNKIAQAAQKSGRTAESVKLVAVSKTHPLETLQSAMLSGASVFGENKIQEAESKISFIGRENAEWHLIGHLQSNKARKAVKIFDVIQTLDSIELAERLERICFEENRANLSVFAQIDLANETTKDGIKSDELPRLIEFSRTCKHLSLDGLMIIPPYFEDAERVRPFFKNLREIRDELLPHGELSMGMSHDYEIAVEEGATVVRVGTAIFGERKRI